MVVVVIERKFTGLQNVISMVVVVIVTKFKVIINIKNSES
jgi:hypothetical protein